MAFVSVNKGKKKSETSMLAESGPAGPEEHHLEAGSSTGQTKAREPRPDTFAVLVLVAISFSSQTHRLPQGFKVVSSFLRV